MSKPKKTAPPPSPPPPPSKPAPAPPEPSQAAWEPFRDKPGRHYRNREPEPMHESNPDFIGPRTTGQYEEEGLCQECMAGFQAKVFVMNLKEVFRTNYCAECIERMEKESESKAILNRPKTREEKWAGVCPPTYLKTDIERLKKEAKLTPVKPVRMPCPAFLEAILGRPYSERGVGLTGDSRIGKTRLMFALLRRYYLEGKRVMYLYAPDFSDIYAGLMGESAHKGNSYLESCINAEVWFLDDLGKGRLSEAAQRALLRVVEKRTNSERPIFTTTNDDGDTLIDRMKYEDTGLPSEYAGPMVNRLREFCDFYQF